MPNAAHTGLASLENDFDVTIITQNIDDLYEREDPAMSCTCMVRFLKCAVSEMNHW